MKNFKDFGIKANSQSFTGDKIKIKRILNKEIIIHHYKIEDSTIYENKKCLCMQIEFDGEKRIIFTSSDGLMTMIQLVPSGDGFPFKTTIIENEGRYAFS